MKFAFAEERVCERSCIPTARNGRNLRDRITEPGARKVTDPNPGLDGRGFPLKRVAGEFDEAVGQRIGLTVEAHEREIPLDGASLDLDHTHFTAAQLLVLPLRSSSKTDMTETMATVSLLRMNDLMLSVLPSCMTTRSAESRMPLSAR